MFFCDQRFDFKIGLDGIKSIQHVPKQNKTAWPMKFRQKRSGVSPGGECEGLGGPCLPQDATLLERVMSSPGITMYVDGEMREGERG